MGRRRRRYPDRYRPRLSQPDGPITADWKRRHAERKESALGAQRDAAAAFEKLGGRLEIHNQGHHWQIWFGDREVWEWWPSSAKLVIDKAWRRGMHVHRWQDVAHLVQKQRG